jgi:hypothetical protein
MTKPTLKMSTCVPSRIFLYALLVATPAIAQEATPIEQGYWNEARQCFNERPYWLKEWHSLPFCNDALLKLDKDLREREKDAKIK